MPDEPLIPDPAPVPAVGEALNAPSGPVELAGLDACAAGDDEGLLLSPVDWGLLLGSGGAVEGLAEGELAGLEDMPAGSGDGLLDELGDLGVRVGVTLIVGVQLDVRERADVRLTDAPNDELADSEAADLVTDGVAEFDGVKNLDGLLVMEDVTVRVGETEATCKAR